MHLHIYIYVKSKQSLTCQFMFPIIFKRHRLIYGHEMRFENPPNLLKKKDELKATKEQKTGGFPALEAHLVQYYLQQKDVTDSDLVTMKVRMF